MCVEPVGDLCARSGADWKSSERVPVVSPGSIAFQSHALASEFDFAGCSRDEKHLNETARVGQGTLKMREVFESREQSEAQAKSGGAGRRWFALLAVAVAIVTAAGAAFLGYVWPFTTANVIEALQQATSSTVQIGEFHRTYFPHVGCVAKHVTLARGSEPQSKAVMTIEKLTIAGNLSGLFTKHLASIRAEHAQAVFPPIGTGQSWRPTVSKVVVDELIADGAVVEFRRQEKGKAPLKFEVHKFVAHHLASHDPMKFEVDLQNPEPPGEIAASGTFGPWNLDRVSATPVAGRYSFRDADLGAFRGIGGRLSSNGQFGGTLEEIDVAGTTDTPDFMVRHSSHRTELASDFQVKVDARNGNVTLNQVIARVLQTTVVSHGNVTDQGTPKGKTATLDLAVRNGRIQDLLRLFVSEKQSPLSGVVSLHAKTAIPPGTEPFLQKLQMTGDFGVESALVAKAKTEENLGKLSAVARGEPDRVADPEDVLSSLQGHVVVRDGVATFTGLSFRVPGALARMHGTFNLVNEDVNLHGTLFMEASLPKATSGIKSFLLKAIDPFLKKNRRGGAEFPVSITGTYQHPVYRADPV